MSEEPKKAPEQEEDEDRVAILARRNRFVSAALKGLAGASLVAACLPACDDGTTGTDAGVSDASADATPQPCLSPIIDASPDTARDSGATDSGSDASDAGPQPCLAPLPPDASSDANDQ